MKKIVELSSLKAGDSFKFLRSWGAEYKVGNQRGNKTMIIAKLNN